MRAPAWLGPARRLRVEAGPAAAQSRGSACGLGPRREGGRGAQAAGPCRCRLQPSGRSLGPRSDSLLSGAGPAGRGRPGWCCGRGGSAAASVQRSGPWWSGVRERLPRWARGSRHGLQTQSRPGQAFSSKLVFLGLVGCFWCFPHNIATVTLSPGVEVGSLVLRPESRL